MPIYCWRRYCFWRQHVVGDVIVVGETTCVQKQVSPIYHHSFTKFEVFSCSHSINILAGLKFQNRSRGPDHASDHDRLRLIPKKSPIWTYSTSIWRPRWLRWNFAEIFRIIKLGHRGYHLALLALSHLRPFWYSAGLWHTHEQTQDDSI